MKLDRFNLSLPAKAEYILTVRMLVASIASRMDFSVDTIEDIKSGAAEACILFLAEKNAPETLNLEVRAGDEFMIVISGEGESDLTVRMDDGEEELAKCLIDEFFDDTVYGYNDGALEKIELKKRV